MRYLFLLLALMLCTICANAEIKFQSLDNNGATHVVLIDYETPKNVQITDAVLYSAGRGYRAKQIRCNVLKDGVAVYKLTFKRLTLFKDCKISLKVNGAEKMINIQRNLNHK